MTTNAHGGTAKIIQFPKGGRSGMGGDHIGARAAEQLASMRVAWVECGGASYHEEAIREADRAHDF